MQSKKPGLADLKRLRAQREAAPEVVRSRPARPRRDNRRGTGARSSDIVAKGPQQQGAAQASPAPRQALDATAGPDNLPAEDRALFKRAMKSVQPIKPSGRMVLSPVPRAPNNILKQRRQAAAGTEKPAPQRVSDHYTPSRSDGSNYLKAGHGPDLLKRLRQGKWPIQATLDLHGSTLDEARGRLDQFLVSCVQHNIKCVRVIHGKGYGSQRGEPVLKETVRRWLAQVDHVLAYTECSEPDGGTGAVQALLKVEQ